MGLDARKRAAIDHLEAILRAHAPPLAPESPSARPCPELNCLTDHVSEKILAAAERRAVDIKTGADRVLITAGAVDEEVYLRKLARWLGVEFETFDDVSRDDCPLSDDRLIESVAAGILPLRRGGQLELVVSPRGQAARRITGLIEGNPALAARVRLTSGRHLQSFIFVHAAQAIGERATRTLHDLRPDLSAGPPRWRYPFTPALALCAFFAGGLIVAPGPVTLIFEILLTLVFLSWMLLRIAGTLVGRPTRPHPARLSDGELPTYSVLIALYREAAAVPSLVEALRNLDYPPEKLDIKLIVEEDDSETQGALYNLDLHAPFEVFVVPDIGPRTKPKALNAALPLARGTFAVIYDAEDRPQPDQLRRAIDAFLSYGRNLACVQASLTIDNTADNWITGLFTAEYAGQFDVFLPALTALGLPLPLGGSSNHFRTTTLRSVGAWDPFNVTEDADLGLRLARFGFRSIVIEPTTYEEAPAQLGNWLRQRTRWFKGWMQTWLVHMREPSRLRREVGLGAFIAMQLMVGGNVLASLVHPLLIIWLIYWIVGQTPVWEGSGTAALFGLTVIFGYAASAALGAVGLFRRRLLAHAWVLVLMPLHWLMLAVAAWRALYQLLRHPYRWEKTEHGLARTSRLARRKADRHVPAGALQPAAQIQPATGNGADRPPPLPAFASS